MTGAEPAPSDRTRLLRAAADDVLTDAERAELLAHLERHPRDASVIGFERRLRGELARVFAGDDAPSDLERRIRGTSSPRRPLVGRRTLAFAAAAAVLALASLAIRGFRSNPDEYGFAGRGRLVRFLGTHSGNCPITIQRTIEEFDVRRLDEAVSGLGSLLGEAPRIADLAEAGLEFRGMRRCGVPGRASSMHLMFTGSEGFALEGVEVSFYLQRDDGRLPIREGATYRLEPQDPDLAGVRMFVWQHGGLDYFVVTPNVDLAPLVLASAGAPAVTGVL